MSLLVWLPLNGDFKNQGLYGDINFTATGTVSDVDGKIGKAKGFASSNVIAPFSFTLGSEASVCCWVYYTAFPSTSSNDWIFEVASTSSYANGVFALSTYHKTLLTVIAGGKYDSTYTHGFSLNTWYHIAFVWKGSTAYLYINGDLKKTYTNLNGGTVTTGNKISLGSNVANSSTKLNGRLNDVRLYDNALSAKEVKEISKGLLFHYPLNRRGFGRDNLATCTTQQQSLVASSSNNYCYIWVASSAALEPNTTYTFSAEVESDNVTKCTVYNYTSSGNSGSINHNFPVDGKRHSWTFTTTTTALGFIVYAGVAGSTANHSVTYRNIKIEKGDKATPYIPKSTETLYSTLALNNNIEYDSSGYCYDGEQVGTFEYDVSSPKYDISTKFASNHITKTPFSFVSSSWTISFWYFYTTAPSAYQGIICFSKGDGSDANKKFAAMPNSSYIWFKFENKTSSLAAALKTNQWTHIVMTCDGSTGKVYVNGSLQQTVTSISSIYTDCQDLVIGARASAAGATSIVTQYTGKLSDVRIYATALSDDDVLELYNNNKLSS